MNSNQNRWAACLRRHRREPLVGLLAVLGLATAVARAAPATTPATSSSAGDDADSSADLQELIASSPVAVGPPDANHRINMAARSAQMPQIVVIAPPGTGYSEQARPTLYWFVSASTSDRVDVAVVEPGQPQPLFKWRSRGASAGLHAITWPGGASGLELGKIYRVTAALTDVSSDPHRTVYSTAFIRRVVASAPPPDASPAALARAGLWYDVFDRLCDQISANPNDVVARRQRDLLLQRSRVFQTDVSANTPTPGEMEMLHQLDQSDGTRANLQGNAPPAPAAGGDGTGG